MAPIPPPEGTPPRAAALAILRAVRRGEPFERALDREATRLSDVDRRLAYEIAAGILRHEAELDRILAPHATRGWTAVSDRLKDLLRLGAYQLRFLDRIPPHAAVSTSVDLARSLRGKKKSGFVNAVLRKVAAEREATGSGRAAGPGSGRTPAAGIPPDRLAAAYSHPAWLVDRWLDRFGPRETTALLEWNNRRPPLVLQPARASLADIARSLEQGGIPFRHLPHGMGLALDRGRPAGLPGYREGAFLVQDAAQAWVIRFADIPTNATVIDACAAPGGKTVALSRVARLVVASDRRRQRIPRLRQNIQRAAPGPVAVVVAEAQAPPVRDLPVVLVDAPCTATGTLARHPDARRRLQPDSLLRPVAYQAAILEGVAGAVAPGGLLVYATCSLEPEENEQQVNRFLERHPGFRRDPPAGVPEELLSPVGDLTVLPHRHMMDGAYAARLRRDTP